MRSLRHLLFVSPLVLSGLVLAAETENEGMHDRVTEALKADAKSDAKPLTPKEPKTNKTTTKPKSELAATTSTSKNGEKVETMEALNVEASKLPAVTPTIVESRVEMRKMQEQIDREKENTNPTDVDKALNGDGYSVMGNLSASNRADDAKHRVKELEVKQSVAACVADPKAEEENKKLMEMLRDLEYQKKHSN